MRDIEYEHEEGEYELNRKKIVEVKKQCLLSHIQTDSYWIKQKKAMIRRKYAGNQDLP